MDMEYGYGYVGKYYFILITKVPYPGNNCNMAHKEKSTHCKINSLSLFHLEFKNNVHISITHRLIK